MEMKSITKYNPSSSNFYNILTTALSKKQQKYKVNYSFLPESFLKAASDLRAKGKDIEQLVTNYGAMIPTLANDGLIINIKGKYESYWIILDQLPHQQEFEFIDLPLSSTNMQIKGHFIRIEKLVVSESDIEHDSENEMEVESEIQSLDYGPESEYSENSQYSINPELLRQLHEYLIEKSETHHILQKSTQQTNQQPLHQPIQHSNQKPMSIQKQIPPQQNLSTNTNKIDEKIEEIYSILKDHQTKIEELQKNNKELKRKNKEIISSLEFEHQNRTHAEKENLALREELRNIKTNMQAFKQKMETLTKKNEEKTKNHQTPKQQKIQKKGRTPRNIKNIPKLNGNLLINAVPNNLPLTRVPLLQWKDYAKDKIDLKNKYTAECIHSAQGGWGSCMANQMWQEGIHEVSLEIVNCEGSNMMIGVVDTLRPFNPALEFCGETESSWSLYAFSGLYHNGKTSYPFGRGPHFKTGDIVTIRMNCKEQKLAYLVNGKLLGVGHHHVSGLLNLCISLYSPGNKVKILSYNKLQ